MLTKDAKPRSSNDVEKCPMSMLVSSWSFCKGNVLARSRREAEEGEDLLAVWVMCPSEDDDRADTCVVTDDGFLRFTVASL